MDVKDYWELYEKEINQIIGRTIKHKHIKDTDDLISDAYFWLTEAYNKYNPEYNIPFKNYALNYLHLRFIQYNKIQLMRNSGIIKGNVAEMIPFSSMGTEDKNYEPTITCVDNNDEFELNNIINKFPHPLNIIIQSLLNGNTQNEIAKKLNVSQSTISYALKGIRNSVDNPNSSLYLLSNKLYNYIKENVQ